LIYYSKKQKSELALTASEKKIPNANDREDQEQKGESLLPSKWDFSDLCLRRDEQHVYDRFVSVICKDMVTEFIATRERVQTDAPTVLVNDYGLEQDLTLLEEHIRNYRKALGGVLFPMRQAHAASIEPNGGQRGLSI
jgi:hypothetical protein